MNTKKISILLLTVLLGIGAFAQKKKKNQPPLLIKK